LLSRKKELKSLLPDTILGLKMYPKWFCGRVSAPNTAGEAQCALRDLPVPATSAVWEVWKVEGCREAEGKEGGRGREREGGGGRRSEGIDAPYLTRQGSGSAAKVMT